MRFSIRLILFGLMPYLAVMATLWTGKAPLSGEATLIVGYYFTIFWPLIVALGFIALDRIDDSAATKKSSESTDEGSIRLILFAAVPYVMAMSLV